MKLKTTLILLIIAGLIAVFYIFIEPRLHETKPPVGKPQIFDKNELLSIKKIEIERAGQRIICELKTPKGKDQYWQIIEPINVMADYRVIRDMNESLSWVDLENIIPMSSHLKLGEYGLAKPRLCVVVHTKNTKYVLKFGNESKLAKDCIYMQLGDEQVAYAIHKKTFEAFDKTTNEIRDKRICNFLPTSISKVILYEKYTGEGAKMDYDESVIERKQDKWFLIKPFEEELDKDRVMSFITDVCQLEALDFVNSTGAPGKFGFDKAEFKVKLFDTEEHEKTYLIEFGGTLPEELGRMYVKSSTMDEIAILEIQRFTMLTKSRDQFRKKEIFDFKKEDIKEITLTTKFETIKIAREEISTEKDGKQEKVIRWKLIAPEGAKTKEHELEDFVKDILEIKVDRFFERQPLSYEHYGLTEPRCKLAITLEKKNGSGTETKSYLFSKVADGTTPFGKREEDTQVFSIYIADYELLERGSLCFLDDVVFSLPKDSIKSIYCEVRYETLSGQEFKDIYSVGFLESEKKWVFEKPEGKEVSEDRLYALIARLVHIRAERYLTRNPDKIPKFRLDKPGISVKIGWQIEKDGEKKALNRTLLISSIDKRHYAKFEDDNIIFEIEETLTDLLKTGIHKR